MDTEFTLTQKRALAVATVIAILFAAYFLRVYFMLIVVAAIAAHLFTPLFVRLTKRFSKGLAASLTLLAAIGSVIVPIGLLVLLAGWIGRTDLSALGEKALRFVDDLIARAPFANGYRVTPDSLRAGITSTAQHVGQWLLGLVQNAAGSVFGAVTAAILFLYVFISLLTNREQIRNLIGQLNPLGEDVTDLYLDRMGVMVRATVRGQFVIVWHLLVVTNIDNMLRPFLVPREARLDPALMLLAVFAGIAMFGAWGIIVGPVVMIVIVTTINVYLAVFRGVPMDQPEEADEKPRRNKLFGWLARRIKRDTKPAALPPNSRSAAP